MIRYRTLFEVDIAHDYFTSRGEIVLDAQSDADRAALTALYSAADVLDIQPDAATLATLAGHRLVFRSTRTGFFVAAQVDASTPPRPLVAPGGAFRLAFLLRVRDARFANYTELGQPANFYRFGNDALNRVAGVSYLSRPVPAFDPTRRYLAGDVRAEAAGPTFDLFLALRDSGPAATPVAADWRRIPADTFSASASYRSGAVVLAANRVYRALVDAPGTDLTNAAQWQPVALLGNQYAGAADAMRADFGFATLDIASAALTGAIVRVTRAGAATPLSEQRFAAEQGTLSRIRVDLRALPSGICRLDVLDDAQTPQPGLTTSLFVAPDARSAGAFGVIEITRGTADYALLDGAGALRSPRYVLRFLNRATRWRYIFPAAQAVGAGADVAAEGADQRVLVTAAARPLSRFGAGSRLQADVSATPASEEILLPAPEVDRLRRQNDEWFSETHLPNLTLGP
ncbi:MAG: hypothetical protein BGP24_02465 [Lysobacterales bacterium 69-70]|nr:hypothetical protein [Xanthomonadaceae bacterium]ODU31904.1 MAG: hypothetical protein ABS97_16735 [Xanthomonadaceae bacterium SCN 69-320]ODV19961.1 MAG: hypothetical protein ABT27_08660 [Xanthomonadaceae bacterium SCN 69-25]OJZ01628.1 MAG: hypothetical protein BGP24_02465 [Xanthomonadales bacterium 69-70]